MNAGRTVLVTGGTRGIGRAIVQRCLRDGWNVAFTWRTDEPRARSLVGELGAGLDPGRLRTYPLDLADDAAAQALAAQVAQDFGRLDALVNNAGLTDDGAFLTLGRERWQRVLATNFRGTATLCLACLPLLQRAPAASLVIVASLAGVTGKEGQVAYATSKGALIGLTKWLGRQHGASGLRVNAIAPGFVRTDMVAGLEPAMYEHILQGTALRRIGEPTEIADAVAFLLQGSYLQATTLRLDGGFLR